MRIDKSILVERILLTAFWLRAVSTFIFEEIIPPLESFQFSIALLFDAVIVGLGLLTMRNRYDLLMAAAVLVASYVSSCVLNDLPLIFFINGLRDVISLMFIVPIIRYLITSANGEGFVRRLDMHLFVFLVVQAFCLVYQYFTYGAGDHGGGSLGNGFSGMISTLIFLVSFYLMTKRLNYSNFFYSIITNKWLVILLIPAFLNETKISFFFLFMYFVLLVPIDKKIIVRSLAIIPVVCVALWGALLAYTVAIGEEVSDAFTLEYYTEMYLMNEDSEEYAKWLVDADNGEDLEDIPRFTKLFLLEEVSEDHPGHRLLGFGLGHFKGGTTLEVSDFYREYEWLLYGSIPYLFHMLVQLGFIGMVLFMLFWAKLLVKDVGFGVRNYNVYAFVMLAIVALLLYNDSFRNAFMMLVFVYCVMASGVNHRSVSHSPAVQAH